MTAGSAAAHPQSLWTTLTFTSVPGSACFAPAAETSPTTARGLSDPRWNDLSVETVWDKFVKSAVTHYKNRSVIYEIENEPEFDHWDNLKDQYAKFTIRTARLIKQTDPKAKVMVDNVYGIPSGVNAVFFKAGGLKFIDVMSWHDYHAGWRMKRT